MLVAFILLIISGCFIIYTYFGYAQILRLLAKQRSAITVAKTPPVPISSLPSIAILVCAFNEAQRITAKIDNCLALDYPIDKLRVVVISDGSTDGTNDLVQNHPSQRVSLINAPKRQGKASCLNLGMEHIHEDIVIMVDVRQKLSPNAARDLVRHFRDPAVGAVTGQLQLEPADDAQDNGSFSSGISRYWRHELQLRKTEALVHSVIGVTGAIYALRRRNFHPIPHSTILDDVLIPMNVIMDGYHVRFEERALAFDQTSTHPAEEQRRKVRTLAGNFQLLAIRPELLNPRQNPVLWMFVSHKVMRLLVPVALLIAIISSAALLGVHWLFALSFWTQIAAYTISLLPEKYFRYIALGPLRAIRTFVHMHWYVILGFYEYMTNTNAHIWSMSLGKR